MTGINGLDKVCSRRFSLKKVLRMTGINGLVRAVNFWIITIFICQYLNIEYS
jgi:hypothetical protein